MSASWGGAGVFAMTRRPGAWCWTADGCFTGRRRGIKRLAAMCSAAGVSQCWTCRRVNLFTECSLSLCPHASVPVCVCVCVSVYVLTWWSDCLIPKAQVAKITPCVTLDSFYCSCLYFVYSRAHSKWSNNIHTEFKVKKKEKKEKSKKKKLSSVLLKACSTCLFNLELRLHLEHFERRRDLSVMSLLISPSGTFCVSHLFSFSTCLGTHLHG